MQARRRSPVLMSRGKWITLIVVALLLIVTALVMYYSYIQSDRWQERDIYQAMAKREAGLVKVDAVSKFVWDDVYWVVRGTDGEGESKYVWLHDERQPLVIDADASVTSGEIGNRLTVDKPDVSIDRIQPGMLQDRPVWEVLYTRKSSPRNFYYDFYDFRDGTKLGTYTLPAKLDSR